ALMAYLAKNRTLVGFPEAESITNEELFTIPVDVMIPAAIDGVITGQNASKVQAKIIAEGANGPITTEALRDLEDRGTFIVPDILCNAGGVIVSYFEWVQGIQNFFWSEKEVNAKLAEVMESAFKKVVDVQTKHRCGM